MVTKDTYRQDGNGILNHGIKKPFLWWVLSCPLLITSFILLLYIYLANYPFWGVDSSPTSAMESYAWLFTINTTAPNAPQGDLGFVKYGFGVWGWCEWGSSLSARTQPARCFGGGAWQIPVDMGPGSTVDSINLPAAITKSLSGAGISLVFPLVVSAFFALLSASSTRFKGPAQPPCLRMQTKKGMSKTISFSDWEELWRACPQHRYRMGLLLRWFWIGFVLLVLEAIPTFMVAGIVFSARSRYKAIAGVGYEAKAGIGTTLLIAAYCLQVWALFIVWTRGLWRQRHGKYLMNRTVEG